MTVKLLMDWPDSRDGKQYLAGNLLTTDAGTESGLVAANMATTTLTGGTAYVAPTVQPQYNPVYATKDLTGGIEISVANRPALSINATQKNNIVCDWNSNGGLNKVSSNSGEILSYDTALGMVKCTQGASGTFIGEFVFTNPVYLAQLNSLQIPVRFESNALGAFTGASNSLQVWIFDDATGTRQWRVGASLRALDAGELRSGTTHVVSLAPGAGAQGWTFGGTSAPTATSDMDAYTINRIRIVFVNTVAGAACWLGPISANARSQGGVSIVLDGQYSSQSNYILPMLEAQGLRASLALQHQQIDTDGRMTSAQLQRAYDAGHELIHHTFNGTKSNGYQNATDWVDQAAIYADIKAGQDSLLSRGWTRGIGYAVHGGAVMPYSATVAQTRQDAVTSAYRAAGIKAIRRGNITAGFLQRLQNVSRPDVVDPYVLSGAVQITSTTTAADLTDIFARVKARGEWAIITAHRSVLAAPASLEMLNSDFATWITALGGDARTGAIEVRPFGEMCRYYGLTS